jgi:hypothetical protein
MVRRRERPAAGAVPVSMGEEVTGERERSRPIQVTCSSWASGLLMRCSWFLPTPRSSYPHPRRGARRVSACHMWPEVYGSSPTVPRSKRQAEAQGRRGENRRESGAALSSRNGPGVQKSRSLPSACHKAPHCLELGWSTQFRVKSHARTTDRAAPAADARCCAGPGFERGVFRTRTWQARANAAPAPARQGRNRGAFSLRISRCSHRGGYTPLPPAVRRAKTSALPTRNFLTHRCHWPRSSRGHRWRLGTRACRSDR